MQETRARDVALVFRFEGQGLGTLIEVVTLFAGL